MSVEEQIKQDLNVARKSQDKLRVSVLSMTIAELNNKRIELGRTLEDSDVVAVLTKGVKRRTEAADQMRAAGRVELAEKEEQERTILQGYLPDELTEAQVREWVQSAIDAGASKMGDVMKELTPKTRGRFDGKQLSTIVKEMLG